jgi:hypothetical protein
MRYETPLEKLLVDTRIVKRRKHARDIATTVLCLPDDAAELSN